MSSSHLPDEAPDSGPQAPERTFVPVRDKRNRDWHWKLNALHDEFLYQGVVYTFGAVVGASAAHVYDYLCRSADQETQSCFPSVPLVAFVTGLSDATVSDSISILEYFGLIDRLNREAEEGDLTSNIYLLLPVEHWNINGGLTEITPRLKERLDTQRAKLIARKVPQAFRRKYFPRSKVSVQVAQNLDYPTKSVVPPAIEILNQGAKSVEPPLYQELPYPNKLKKTSPPSGAGAPPAPAKPGDEVDSSESEQAAAPLMPQTSAFDVKARILELASHFGISATDEEAATLTQRWPAAALADDQIFNALTGDYSLHGLDKPVDENIAREMIAQDVGRVRWFLCVWPAFEESTDAYHERTKGKWTKTGCFVRKWKTASPHKAWLQGQFNQMRHEAKVEAARLADAESEAFHATLTPKQKRELVKECIAMYEQKHSGETIGVHSPGFTAWRNYMLRDSDTREWLLAMEAPAAAAGAAPEAVASSIDVSAPATGQEPQEDAEEWDRTIETPTPKQLSLEMYVGPILEKIQSGRLRVELLDEYRDSVPLLEDDEWQEVITEVLKRVA